MDKKELYRGMGERLREYRNQLNYTQEQMAEELEMSLTYYGKVERGCNGLSLEKLLLAYQKLDINLVYLLTGENGSEMTFDGLMKDCPRDKRYELEQLIRYAMELVR